MSTGSAAPDPCREQLRRILESKSLRHSENLRRLLSYLAERSLSHSAEELKEYTIGVEVFGRPASYDPQKDASVRVQVSRLRQKLEEYQKTEGGGDPYRVELPKGRFTILFEPRDGAPQLAPALPSPIPAAGRSPARIGLGVALVLLAASMTWTVLLWRKVNVLESNVAGARAAESSKELDAVWAAFFNPAVPAIAVFGSPPFFASPKYGLFVRTYRSADPDDPRSSPEFADIEGKIGPLQGPRFDYASMGDAIGVQRLTALFGSRGLALRALPAHLAVWDAVQGANLIFLGAARMNPLLRRLPVQQDFELGADGYIHNRNPGPGEEAVYATPSHRDTMSYAVVATYPGLLPGHEILVLAAHSSPGAVGVVNFVTSPEGVRVIREKLKLQPGERKHFQVLLRVFADNDAPVKTEYVTHHLAP